MIFYYKKYFYEISPQQKIKQQKIKTTSTVSKISKLKSQKMLQNLGHTRFCSPNLEDASKRAKKKIARVLFCFTGVREASPTTKKLNTAPAT